MAGTDQMAGDSFVEHPDEIKIEKDDGSSITFCWRDHDRVCTGGCQAFDPMYADDETAVFTSCRILNLGIAFGAMVTDFLKQRQAPKGPIPGTDVTPPGVR